MDANDPGTPVIPSRHETPLHVPTSDAPAPAPAGPPPSGERRRTGWGEFRHAYPGILATMAVAFLVMLTADAWLIYKNHYYTSEVARLRSGMSDA